MSHESILYGCIVGPQRSRTQDFFTSNTEIIQSLVDVDEYPPLTRSMFSVPADGGEKGLYITQIIYFGASIKEFEGAEWTIWLEKFEKLLSKLIWKEVFLHLYTDLHGYHYYKWIAAHNKILRLFDDPKPRISKWIFEGGPRNFDF